jgi:putative oxidoreductase
MSKPLVKLIVTTPTTTGLALLVLRLAAGGMMAFGHGLGKLRAGDPSKFPDPLGIGSTMSYYGAVGAEFFCALLVAAGLFTRLACIPMIFTMGVAALVVHRADPLFMSGGAAKEPALIYLFMFLAILLAGPGKFSLDHALFARKGPN